MSKKVSFRLIAILTVLIYSVSGYAQNAVNWTPNQLIEPSVLANEVTSRKDVPLIISVGPGAIIPQ